MLATVVFTDIVGSTQRAAELGDAEWHRVLERHDDLVRSELGRWRGREVKQLGDGFLASFEGPARAIRCAQAIAEGVRQLGLEIRTGSTRANASARGDDLAGMAVHIGARVGRPPPPARSSSRAPCATSSSARASSSPTAARASSRACPASGALYAVA